MLLIVIVTNNRLSHSLDTLEREKRLILMDLLTLKKASLSFSSLSLIVLSQDFGQDRDASSLTAYITAHFMDTTKNGQASGIVRRHITDVVTTILLPDDRCRRHLVREASILLLLLNC